MPSKNVAGPDALVTWILNKMIFTESVPGSTHYEETVRLRVFPFLTAGDKVWWILGHVIILPLAVVALILTVILLPVLPVLTRFLQRLGGSSIAPRVHADIEKMRQETLGKYTLKPGMAVDEGATVSIVVPFFNRGHLVHECLRSLLDLDVRGDHRVEIIAVDNRSTDNTRALLENYPVRIVDCVERGPGAARNAGLAAARGRIIAFTDSDCIADREWLVHLLEPFYDPDTLVAGGRIESLTQDNYVATFTDTAELLSNKRFFEPSAYFARFFATANVAYRADVLRQVGGFDNSLWMSEDADLCWRVLDHGGRMAYVPEAVIYHQHRGGLKGLFNQAVDYGSASVSVFAKHRARLKAKFVVSWKNLRDLAWSPFAVVLGLIYPHSPNDRSSELFYMVWRLGFAIGCIRSSWRHRVFFF